MPTSTPANSTLPAQRSAALDAVRAVAVIAMVMGHTLDATVSPEARLAPAVQVYWLFRGVTAPLFLCVAGWAMTAALARSGLRGAALLRRYLPRVGLLLACGVFLRWPGWDLPGLLTLQRPVWEHLLAFDALHCVAGSILVAGLLFAWMPWRSARVGVALGVLVLLPWLSPALLGWVSTREVPLPLAQALARPPSPFPLFPWAAYFFSGVLLRELLEVTRRVPPAVVTFGLGVATIGLLASPLAAPFRPDLLQFYWRLALMLPVVSVALLLPQRLALRLSPVGRASLWAYVLHLPIAYGWSTIPGLASRVGQTLSFGQAFLLGLAVLAVTLALALWAKGHLSPLKQRLFTRVTAGLGTLGNARRAPVLAPHLTPPKADARP